jgi:hypothetical protein
MMMPFICSYRNKIEDNNAVPEWVGRLGGEGFWVGGDDDDDVFYFLLRGGGPGRTSFWRTPN